MTTKRKSEPETLDAIRARLAELTAERAALEREPVDRAAALANIDAWIAARAARCSFDVRAFASAGGDPGAVHAYTAASADVPGAQHVDVSPGLCLLAPDAVRARLVGLVDDAGIRYGRTAAARTARRDEIDTAIADLERREELAVRALEDDGRDVARRPDTAHPLLAILTPEALAA